MNEADLALQKQRISDYGKLQEELAVIRENLEALNRKCFTNDWRESRCIDSLIIHFSVTKGGAPETDMGIVGLGVSASEFSEWLRTKLTAKRDSILAQMEKI